MLLAECQHAQSSLAPVFIEPAKPCIYEGSTVLLSTAQHEVLCFDLS